MEISDRITLLIGGKKRAEKAPTNGERRYFSASLLPVASATSCRSVKGATITQASPTGAWAGEGSV